MKVAAIIAEYNPLHNGHIYHINKTKKNTGADFLIVIMSGTFTQGGNISLFDKFDRAKIACMYGADLVIELPTIYATASSNEFAYGAINILNSLNIVDYLSFGVETDNIVTLTKISNILVENCDKIDKLINVNLKNGMSYADSRAKSLEEFLSEDELNIISKSNNILAIEYLKQLQKLNSTIMPVPIKRKGNTLNDSSISSDSFISATAIRNHIKHSISDISTYVPNETYSKLSNISSNEDLFNIIKYKIITLKRKELENIYGVSKSMINRIVSSISCSNSYDDFILNVKTKNYQHSRIKRVMINILLNITKNLHDELITSKSSLYVHVLGKSKNGNKLLSMISKKSDLKIITSLKRDIINSKDDIFNKNIKLDILSTNIQAILLKNDKLNKDYTNKI